MNREIKFRAYQEKLNRMWEWNELNDLPLLDLERKDLDWMQFTGLHDSKGVEIYEGDIITFTEIDEDSCMGREDTYTGKVEWIEEISQWRFIYPSGQRTELHFIVQLPTIKSCEVIGNIYQNKDLNI